MGPGRALAVAIGLLVAGSGAPADALVAPTGARVGAMQARSVAVRTHRDVAASRTLTATHRALASELRASGTLWDNDTGVLLRMWGAGATIAGAIKSPTLAARSAREFVDRHLAALAPGAAPSDFIEVANDERAGIRSVGYMQHYKGRRVLGGQVSVRYKADRLVAVASEALPNVRAALTAKPVTADVARASARAWILEDSATAVATAVDGPYILPLVAPGKVRGYREVLRVTVDAAAPIGKFDVYVDAATGAPIAREQKLMFASGTVAFNVPQRGPQATRIDLPAPFLNLTVNGAGTATDGAGAVGFADGPPAAVTASSTGQFVAISSFDGPSPSKDLSLPPAGVALWSDAADEAIDAHLATYIHVNIVKQRLRGVAPGFAYIDDQLPAVVNIPDVCNAFSDGNQINFFLSGDGCENTGRISDVIYHEYGHSVHVNAIIPGVGLFEGALSEGISDYLSSTLTDDSGLARGFFVDTPNEPLRESNPVGDEFRWPEDVTGLVHDDGLIIAGTLWDLREALKAKLGPDAGIARTDHIWFQSISRAVDIPTMYPEALLADDDDGDLSNGTPNACEINLAFQRHGLLGAGAISGSVALGAQQAQGFPVDVTLVAGAAECVDIAPTGAVLRTRVVGSDGETEIAMTPTPSGFTALIPIVPDGTLVEYQVELSLSDGGTLDFPRNPGDPFYQLYVGPVTPLFCSGFENPPQAEGWSLSGEFEFGATQGKSNDPSAAFVGAGVAAVNLAGAYAAGSSSSLQSPTIDTQGFPTVRLQYRRWLNVEDGVFDQAAILARGAPVWQNTVGTSTTHTTDQEWRFHDVDLTERVENGQIDVGFTLTADGGLELGGWTIDQLCIVGTNQSAGPVCGDGVVDVGEGCDNGGGNSDSVPGACRTTCQPARCADLVIDPGEMCDDGNLNPGDGCSATCQAEPAPPSTTTDVPTEGGDDGDSETDSAASGDTDPGLDDDLADRPGCACDEAGSPASLTLLCLAALALPRRRRR